MPSTVSAIIVNYNGAELLPDCLRSLLTQTHVPDEVIVVDNASTDASLEILSGSDFADRVRVVPLPANVGYPAGCNRGISEAQGSLLAILNNDIVLDRRWLETLLAQDTPEWDFWASQIVFAFDPERIDSAGDEMAVIGTAYKRGHGHPRSGFNQQREVFGPCAAAALYRRELLSVTGGFDPDFFLIYEDADLNMRARLQGYRCLYVPEARVVHRVNSSIGTFSRNYVFFGHRNSEYVFWKNMPTSLLVLYLPERLLFDMLSFFFFLGKGRGGTYLRAKAAFLLNFGRLLHKRRRIQGSRKVSARHFRSMLDRNWLRYRGNVTRRS